MNHCPFDKEKLTGYYDGEVYAAGKAEVEDHISSCSECLRDLGEIKSAAILVRDLPRFRAPRPIAENVAREIAIAGRVHLLDRFRRRLLWGTAAAAGLLVVANVIYFREQGRSVPSMASGPGASPAAPSAPAPARKSAGTVAYTLSVLQMDKARPRVDEILRKAKLAPVAPALNPMLTLELTDAELVELKTELDKQVDMRLIPGAPDDSRLAVGARMERDGFQDSQPLEESKAEQFDRAAAVTKDKSAEPRRRIILHFLEVKALPAGPAK
jgi:anti-sigma factor RsiW